MTCRNISRTGRFGHFDIYPDPVVEKFRDVRYYRPDDYLTINGEYFDAAARERDIVVTVGGEVCNITVLGDRALTCRPPLKKPRSLRDEDPEVIVRIGEIKLAFGYS